MSALQEMGLGVSVVDNLGQQLMNVSLEQAQQVLTGSFTLLVIALLNIAIVDVLLTLAGFGKFTRVLVAISIFIATMMKMSFALFLFNLLGLPLMLAVAVGGIFLKIVLSPAKAVKKMKKRR